MIGLDTNVLVRYLVQDDPKQSAQAERFIKQTIKKENRLWISVITLCEMVWVLENCYAAKKKAIIQIIQKLLETKQLKIEAQDVVWEALKDYEKHSKVDFPDCLIGRFNQAQGCSCTYTFDRAAAKALSDTLKPVPND